MIGLGPSVEGDAERIGFQYSIGLLEDLFEPPRTVIVGKGAATIAGLVSHQIRRIGDDQIERFFRNGGRDFQAVSVSDAVEKRGERMSRASVGRIRMRAGNDASSVVVLHENSFR